MHSGSGSGPAFSTSTAGSPETHEGPALAGPKAGREAIAGVHMFKIEATTDKLKQLAFSVSLFTRWNVVKHG